MLPPFTDFVALLGIALVLCFGFVSLIGWKCGVTASVKWITGVFFVLLWCPFTAAQLPIVAYVRGISSDPSMTLVALAGLGLFRLLFGSPAPDKRERMAVHVAIGITALFFYPLALGWGDWDVYRAGWGSLGLGAALLLLSLFCWALGLRLLPMLVALALLAWAAGALESSNLWDYLIDPWLALAAIFQCLKSGTTWLFSRLRKFGFSASMKGDLTV